MTEIDLSDVEWTDELSAVDYAMFRAEADHRFRSTMLNVETLDILPDWGRLQNDVERASRRVPRLRQKVVAPLIPVTQPKWVIDPDFDLDYHVRRVVLPAPAGMRELLDFAQNEFQQPLDLGRPLWEMTLVEAEGLEDAQAALIWKLSHAVTDGVGGMLMEQIMRHDEREPDLGPMPPIPAPSDESPVDLTRSAVKKLPIRLVSKLVRGAGQVVNDARKTLDDPEGAVKEVVRSARSIANLASGSGVEPSPLLQRRSVNGRFEALHFPLDSIRDAARSQECSVNDAYLAAVCGALGRYHAAKKSDVSRVPLGLPVNMRSATDSQVSNEWSAAIIAAPIDEPDPATRMRLIREQVLTARAELGINPMEVIAPALAWVPQPLLAALAGGTGLGVDVQASNVPGHPRPRFIGGAQITRSMPMGPTPGCAITFTMLSLNRKCSVGINYDTAAISDADLFIECLDAAFAEVFTLGAEKKPRKKTTKKASDEKDADDG